VDFHEAAGAIAGGFKGGVREPLNLVLRRTIADIIRG
jgi:hypothetical protein